ncbi:hypothetical protein AGABI2DRAFT_60530 [Agaricus bisporus var. bisporus H97]|uniref:hypothetical protein n=1 Tax=Agaricus bisporus var. bisporus (strain H97 / ATCC MYA-4626 / FGSC 10389) TaxID=936046 RepID=UPI00029F708D|nr:hypothetical protein AGABI2DRAFT_60530 [Agaricus bisporus var. bisporus H97]EKV51623.1 hypothetical protein AGABI2DRAFT_60530 [Agaricus bisporus var. bisporus H97]
MATLTRQTQTITRTAEGAVAISYSNLVSAPLSLVDAIGEAFGSDPSSLGIIIVRDLPPEYSTYRERLLKLSYQFAHLPENVREKYSHPASKYRYLEQKGVDSATNPLLALAGLTARYNERHQIIKDIDSL